MLIYNNKLKQYSRDLRKNMTDAENLLWSKVRRKQLKGLQFYRQRIIGNYIVDFYVPKARLVIELDGGQHLSDDNQEKDRIRNGYMDRIGLKILRFSNKDVFNNIEGVLEVIYEHL